MSYLASRWYSRILAISPSVTLSSASRASFPVPIYRRKIQTFGCSTMLLVLRDSWVASSRVCLAWATAKPTGTSAKVNWEIEGWLIRFTAEGTGRSSGSWVVRIASTWKRDMGERRRVWQWPCDRSQKNLRNDRGDWGNFQAFYVSRRFWKIYRCVRVILRILDPFKYVFSNVRFIQRNYRNGTIDGKNVNFKFARIAKPSLCFLTLVSTLKPEANCVIIWILSAIANQLLRYDLYFAN